jgi:hypothetical protein
MGLFNIFDIIENAAKDLVSNALIPPNQDFNNKVLNLEKQVTIKQVAYENSLGREITVGQLYGHFFLSILALFECCFRFTFHIILFFMLLLGYYIWLCISCGKAEVGKSLLIY